jgi:supervillin
VESLRARPVPNGVDPVRLETYLTDNDFEVGTLLVRVMLHVIQL